jgi:mRNA interferase RelE/StbE
MTTLAESVQEARAGTLDAFNYVHEIRLSLRDLWYPEPPEEELLQSREPESPPWRPASGIRFSLAPSEPTTWSVALTPTFRKSVAGIDKKLQGRVLVAIAELSEAPNKAHGDTVKPLTGDQKGLWRYRVGDYWLVYEPQAERNTVVLLHFESRGGVYEQ